MGDDLAHCARERSHPGEVKKTSVKFPHSKLKEGVLTVLQGEGYIDSFTVFDAEPTGKTAKVILKYGPRGEKVVNRIERVSKPGRRVYSGVDGLKPVLQGLGISVVSTPQGVLSDREARAKKVGGEVLCRVW